MSLRSKRYLRKISLFLLLFFSIFLTLTPKQADAAVKNGWVKRKAGWYYYLNNRKVKDFWHLDHAKNKWYYMKPKTGLMAQNEFLYYPQDGQTYYFDNDGVMAIGSKKIDDDYYYFKKNQPLGAVHKGWLKIKNKWYYYNKKTGIRYNNKLFKVKNTYYYTDKKGVLFTSWKTIKNNKYYFTENGTYTGWKKINKKWYYFDTKGYVKTGWLSYNNNKYYLSKSTKTKGQRLTGYQTINKVKYYFDNNGILQYQVTDNGSINKPGNTKTIKNFLLNALQPVGNTLYVWGGGWMAPTNTYKGIYPEWKTWFDSKNKNYDFSKYQDLSQKTRAKGLDCAGFVGWSTYQVMHQTSGVNYGYVVEASTVASTYNRWGWGQLRNQNALSKNNYKSAFKAGDIASMSGHTFIILGQCADNSLVIIHATPPCVQINGTTTPNGDWNSQAIILARQYMNKYYPKLMQKFDLSCGVGMSYIKAINTTRWHDYILADPDNYKNKTADAVLNDLFK